MMNLASEMDQSAFLEQFPASFSVSLFPPPPGPWSSLLNRHDHVVCPCESYFDATKLTRPCGLPV
ncbi:hypothetical protein F383_01700 [Gossypium arboreum]|uniref:Uncharacterized protein n=1 Tax=Gossypium arboreum TaxID=29729 RepID=A0A0B0NZU2_GOSAR|nr:hypothetical protein F383_01700 [Gossypium arboreum]